MPEKYYQQIMNQVKEMSNSDGKHEGNIRVILKVNEGEDYRKKSSKKGGGLMYTVTSWQSPESNVVPVNIPPISKPKYKKHPLLFAKKYPIRILNNSGTKVKLTTGDPGEAVFGTSTGIIPFNELTEEIKEEVETEEEIEEYSGKKKE